MALLIAGKAPLPVSNDEIKRAAATAGIRDDYKSVAAVVPATAERRLLIFFHGNSNYVTVAPTGDVPPRAEASGHSRVPRWVSAAGRARIIGVAGDPKNKGVAVAQIKYGFLSLAASQQALGARGFLHGSGHQESARAGARERGSRHRFIVGCSTRWSVRNRQRRKAEGSRDQATRGTGAGVLRASPLPAATRRTVLISLPSTSQRASWVSNIQRTYVVGHSGGGKPLVEAAGADMLLITPSSAAGLGGRAVDLWLFDCTYKFSERRPASASRTT